MIRALDLLPDIQKVFESMLEETHRKLSVLADLWTQLEYWKDPQNHETYDTDQIK